MGRLGWLYQFFQAKTTLLELFNIHFMNRTLTSVFIPNFSQIGELKWLQFFENVQKVQTISLKRLRVTSFANTFCVLVMITTGVIQRGVKDKSR